MRPSERRVPSYAIMLLLSQLFREYNHRGLPPITLSAIVAQILIYFRAIPLPWNPSIPNACLSAHKILYYKDYSKLLISQVEHGDDWHLYYNMVSFMSKGQDLEARMGSIKYALLLGLFTVSTGATYVGLNYILAEVMEDGTYLQRCSVGFSGVIFALKVLTTHELSRSQMPISILGIPLGSSISAKYSVWIELILISLITPNASFVGHLAGILVGLAYVYGPLKLLLDTVHGVIFGTHVVPFTSNRSSSSRFTSTRQATGYYDNSDQYPQSEHRFVPPGMSEADQIRRARDESLRSRSERPTTFSENLPRSMPMPNPTRTTSVQEMPLPQPSLEELRKKRLSRFTSKS